MPAPPVLEAVFTEGRARFAANASVAKLADPAVAIPAKLAVVPVMAFWVLAFADGMALLGEDTGDSPLHDRVRQHASEDAEHWRWFLADLETLAGQGLGASSVADAYRQAWDPMVAPVRQSAFTLHHLLRAHPDPVTRMAVVESCEMGFEAFMDSMRPVIRSAGRYAELSYLGAVHDDAEAGHALHDADPFEGVDWSAVDAERVAEAARTMLAALDRMHTVYAHAIARAEA